MPEVFVNFAMSDKINKTSGRLIFFLILITMPQSESHSRDKIMAF
jgi:hypothetical protein